MSPNKSTILGMAPEAKLLLCCARKHMDAEREEQIRQLLQQEDQQDIDWDYLIELAIHHRMISLLYWQLHMICQEAVPLESLNRLESYFRHYSRRNLYLSGELCRILSLLKDQGISAIPFKGPVLAMMLYGNLALRHSGDLDLLVRKQDFLRAKALLVSMGYRLNHGLTHMEEEGLIKFECQNRMENDNGSIVELHSGFAPRFFSFMHDPDHLWKHSEQVLFAGTEVLTMSPEDLLLILCVHGSKHCWNRLKWICDVAELLSLQREIGWEEVLAQASRLGGLRMVFLGLYLACDLLGAPVPRGVWQKIRADQMVNALALNVRKRLCHGAKTSPVFVEASTRYFHLRSRERRSDRMLYCLRYFPRYYLRRLTTLNGNDYKFLRLPAVLSFLYYAIRPVRLSRQYGMDLLRLLVSFFLGYKTVAVNIFGHFRLRRKRGGVIPYE